MSLSKQNDTKSLPVLLSKLKNEKNRYNQEVLIEKISFFKSEQSVRQIIPLLRSEDAYLRNAAIEILQNIGQESVNILGEVLKDEDKNIRKFALDILKQIPTEESSSLVLEALRDTDSNVIQTAVEVLGIHRYKKALPVLLTIFKSEMNVWVLDSLINALGNFRQEGFIGIIEEKIESDNFNDLEKNILVNSFVRVLGKIGSLSDLEKVINTYIKEYKISDETLIRCISDIINSNEKVSISLKTLEIIEGIYKEKLRYENEKDTIKSIKAASKIQLSFYLNDVSTLIKRFHHMEFFEESLLELVCQLNIIPIAFIIGLLEDDSTDIKVFALKIIRNKKIEGLKPEIEKLCDNDEIKVASEALRIICDIESYMNEELLKRFSASIENELSTIALEGLINHGKLDNALSIQCLKHPNRNIRKLAVKRLISSQDKVDTDEIEAIVKDFKETIGLDALEIMLRLDNEKAESLIKQIMDCDTGSTRKKLVEIIDLLDNESYSFYIKILANDSDHLVRRNVIKSLCKRINRCSFELLTTLLENETNENNKYEIISELYKFQEAESFDMLVSYLDCEDTLLKLAAIGSLGHYGDKRAIGFLRKYIDCGIPDVCDSTKEALERLGV
ncbi:HEAT repeat domain-containing protein [Pseudobacteroides cellulosolvens]|uniref:PBS lyase HEAT domain protein repeat-containing protein n=1 Tax=Pseudobacteroides cellulosolvens ATCC 35603 = DSM 2933 TaxID=398512 RepID=A0A0L6JKI2_9FIRM|nr:HEAT repeat domain-containing protein [Pseudobacteroides cellulosolvens]KNY26289.1 hypothetical protein Bccel_1551 [Pseudobacteroides cellulosolvens ATCC 35603 = DSM 2933]